MSLTNRLKQAIGVGKKPWNEVRSDLDASNKARQISFREILDLKARIDAVKRQIAESDAREIVGEPRGDTYDQQNKILMDLQRDLERATGRQEILESRHVQNCARFRVSHVEKITHDHGVCQEERERCRESADAARRALAEAEERLKTASTQCERLFTEAGARREAERLAVEIWKGTVDEFEAFMRSSESPIDLFEAHDLLSRLRTPMTELENTHLGIDATKVTWKWLRVAICFNKLTGKFMKDICLTKIDHRGQVREVGHLEASLWWDAIQASLEAEASDPVSVSNELDADRVANASG